MPQSAASTQSINPMHLKTKASKNAPPKSTV
eukprot:CAMPEP_0174301696 /NCGR_PEP_ID=MMETSP0809-20121228/59196_1 /TAXON_ID=73025 ORGANISM="Eutreptiella gymnastica-like, Strain CCMP1594" /NCGR_SAMPLE_ID=MMETSP0809 /ASSEMBLY_ACC=CAM_ASM_000658 /LENGTH=30 /DNA_ID= /DNA_START= /DNA_END= /DNA_ORIENTATION=